MALEALQKLSREGLAPIDALIADLVWRLKD
jgi:hypothetical protein